MGKKKAASGGIAVTIATTGALMLLRKVLAAAWTKVTGKVPPTDLTDPKVSSSRRSGSPSCAPRCAGHRRSATRNRADGHRPRGRLARGTGRQAAHSRQISWPFLSSTSWLRWCTRKQREQVNSSACRGITRIEMSSFDKSAPGNSRDSATSSGSRSIVDDDLSIRRACSSCRLSSLRSSSVLRGLS